MRAGNGGGPTQSPAKAQDRGPLDRTLGRSQGGGQLLAHLAVVCSTDCSSAPFHLTGARSLLSSTPAGRSRFPKLAPRQNFYIPPLASVASSHTPPKRSRDVQKLPIWHYANHESKNRRIIRSRRQLNNTTLQKYFNKPKKTSHSRTQQPWVKPSAPASSPR